MSESIWLAIAFPKEYQNNYQSPTYLGTKTYQVPEGDTTTVPGVADIAGTIFTGSMTKPPTMRRSILGGDALFGKRSQQDFGTWEFTIDAVDSLFSKNWRGAPVHFYEGTDDAADFSDFTLRYKLVCASEPETNEANLTAKILLGSADYRLDEPIQLKTYQGYGGCMRGDDSLFLTNAKHPSTYLPADFTITWRSRFSAEPAGDIDVTGWGDGTVAGQSDAQQYAIKMQTDESVVVEWTQSLDDALHTTTFSTAIPTGYWTDDEWHEWAVVRDVTNRTVDLYLDGALAATQETYLAADDPYVEGAGWASDGFIMKRNDTSTTLYDGDLDEVRFYGAVLDAATILDLYKGGPAGLGNDDLRGAYSLDEGAGLIFSGDGFEAFERWSGERPQIREGLLITASTDYAVVTNTEAGSVLDTTSGRIRYRATFALPRTASDFADFIRIAYRASHMEILVSNADDLLYARMYNEGTGWGTWSTSTTTIEPGKIYTLDFTYDQNLDEQKLYINGILEDDSAVITGQTAPTASTSDQYLGATSTTTGDPCWIFDFAIFKGAAANAAWRVLAQYDDVLYGGEPGVALYLPFDEGTGTTLNDTISEDDADPVVGAVGGAAAWVTSTLEATNPHAEMFQDSYSGTPALRGMRIPLSLGLVRGKTPILINPARHIYQLHEREIERVVRATDGGDYMNNRGDVSTHGGTSLLDSTPVKRGFHISGSVATSIGDATVTGTNTAFDLDLRPGEPVWIGPSASGEVGVVLSITNESEFELTANATVAQSGVSLYRSIPRPGYFRTDLANGLIQFGQDPVYGYEVDLKGDVDPISGYSQAVGDLFKRVVSRDGKTGQVMQTVRFEGGGNITFGNESTYDTDGFSFAIGCFYALTSDDIGSNMFLLGKKDTLLAGAAGYAMYINSSGYLVGVISDGTNQKFVTTTTTAVQDGLSLAWFGVDYDADLMDISVNGNSVTGEFTTTVTGSINNNIDLKMGEDGNGTNGLTGNVSMAYWGYGFGFTPWTGAQAWNILPVRLSADGESLYKWRFWEGEGNAVESAVSSTLDGVITGGSWEEKTLKDSEYLDEASITAANTAAPWACGVWTGLEAVPATEKLDLLASAIPGWWGSDALQIISINEFDTTKTPATKLEAYGDFDRESAKIKQALIPTEPVIVNHSQRERVVSDYFNQLGQATPEVAASIADRLGVKWQSYELSRQLRKYYDFSVKRIVDTASSVEWGAERIAAAHLDLFGASTTGDDTYGKSWLVEFRSPWERSQDFEVGDVVNIGHDLWGIRNVIGGTGFLGVDPTPWVVVEKREDPGNFATTVTVWGRYVG